MIEEEVIRCREGKKFEEKYKSGVNLSIGRMNKLSAEKMVKPKLFTTVS